ncbi:MAG: CotH kinase family protein, partial [Fibromonadales bacterium]|nr:CotH kinase family protein [Fibromonadales bacterium]
WPATIKGTGQENDLYTVDLPSKGTFPDLANIYGLRFANTSESFGTISFSFSSIIAHKKGGNIHASFELKKSGGKLFMLDSANQIRDSVAYPAETRDLSFVKNFETGDWSLSKPPTPGSANSSTTYSGQTRPPASTSIPKGGYYETELSFTLPPNIHCDTTGSLPSENSALKPGTPITLAKTAIMRCVQFIEGAYPSEPIMRTYIIGERLPNLPVVSIAVDPFDMFDPVEGLYSTGPNASPNQPYYGANYWRDTELPVQLDFFEAGANHAWSYPAGLEIFGNYSRQNPKKSVAIRFKEKYGQKNLKYSLFPSHPHLTTFKGFILRNNGSNYGQDYIRDMMMTSLTEGLGIDYQKGRAVIVYYNGKYFGIHNLRERANSRYFETNYGIDKDNIDLVKAGNQVSKGSDEDYQDILKWLGNITLSENNLKLLEQRIDVNNFTNVFQSEIYFANRDWPGNNMKRWRSNSPPSKWKWFIYDTDFGFDYPYDNNKNIKMLDFVTDPAGPDWPNPPHSTLILRKLLQNESYKNAFINRFSLLLATYFSPAKVEARINALMQAIANEVPLDQSRWNLNASRMSSQLTIIRNFGQDRASQMQTEIEQFFGLPEPQNITISIKGGGKILVHNLPMPGETAVFKAYSTVPLLLKAEGAGFSGWSDGVKSAERTITVTQATELIAEF